ncbi:glycosyl transferase [Geothermobacter hydrogeniphilus]|uniref:Glycosyl transferase n=1 Tax=Geothermobacter hydrogeniphilus TaxID=1969733 RepID=A0A2K2HCY6_9BACT|nr:glycosyl transferase [Geothermobacter hydrogeniphilus]PNU21157.1 glycosyl transferase [Geothermobacter hydrogeniphilus]
MLILCVEASHRKGLGHLFRAMTLYRHLEAVKLPCHVLINHHPPSLQLLTERGIRHSVVDLENPDPWEPNWIDRLAARAWINDRHQTSASHASRVAATGIPLVTFDDRGPGAAHADLHFAPLVFTDRTRLQGRKIFTGPDFLILTPEIHAHRRPRKQLQRLIVSLGGSDTYGVTLKVLRLLRELERPATIHTGPAFAHRNELQTLAERYWPILERVDSLVATFADFDLAITGGGVTPFEANAAGLPCLVVANEDFEVEVGEYLQQRGSSLFLAHHEQLNIRELRLGLDIAQQTLETMSRHGLRQNPDRGAMNIVREIRHVL